MKSTIRHVFALGFLVGSPALLLACQAPDDLVPLVGGGGSPNTFTYAEGTSVADANVTRDITVEENRLLLPLSYESYARGLVGTVLSGDRAPGAAPNNPFGFLRRIESVSVEGDRVACATSPATLQDLFSEADISFAGEPDYTAPIQVPDALAGPELASPEPSDVEPRSLDLLQEGAPDGEGGGSAADNMFTYDQRFELKLPTKFGAGSASIKGSGYYRRQYEIKFLTDARYRGRGYLRVPNIEFHVDFPWKQLDTLCASIEGEIVANRSWETDLRQRRFEVLSVTVPAPPMGPVPTTVTAKAKLSCGLFASGKVDYQSSTFNEGRYGANFGTNSSGTWYYENLTSQANPQTTSTTIVTGSGGVKCEVALEVQYRFFDFAGAFVQVVPSAQFGLSGDGRLRSTPQETRFEGAVCAEVKVGAALEVGLVAEKFGFEKRLSAELGKVETTLGKACTGPLDNCSIRPNGWYCSEINSQAAYKCTDNAHVDATYCDQPYYCQFNPRDWTRKAKLTDAGGLACNTPQPQAATAIPDIACF